MVTINKSEAKAIREQYPDVHIRRSMKQKSKRGHYFCEESEKVMRLLASLRGETIYLDDIA